MSTSPVVTQVSLKITPDPALHVPEASMVPHQALLNAQPELMLGADRNPPMVVAGVSPDASTCFGPRGAVLLGENGPLVICDTGHHRLLGWNQAPKSDDQPADWVIGHTDFEQEGRNGKGPASATSFNVPTGICAWGQNGMAVADAWNHRILIWDEVPTESHVPADRVLGQDNFTEVEANRGATQTATASSMHWPYGVHCEDGRLFVADSENRRVLIWDDLNVSNGQPADRVLGQRDFLIRDENAGDEPNAMSMRWPHGMAFWDGKFCVSDAGNNRIMVWDGLPDENGADCDWVLGQTLMTLVDHNQSLYWPRENTLNMPYAITAVGDWLVVADTASSRLLGWHIDDLGNGTAARALSGQANFHEKGDNRWQPPCADSFCWPYGLQSQGNRIVVADSGNNRISVWHLTDALSK